MAYPLTRQTTELLDSLVLSTINTMTADPAFLVNDRGEKLLRKMAQRGRVFSEVNDADAIEHPLMIAGAADTDRWKYYRGSRAASGDTTMGSASSLTTDQEDVFSVARSTILDTASNFVVPQDIVKRPVQKQLDTIEALLKRHMNLFFREQESYLVLGGSTPSANPTVLSPHLTDENFGSYSTPSFSLLGLMIDGVSIAGNDSIHGTDLADNKFMGVLGSEAEWSPYIDSYDDAVGATAKVAYNNNNGQDVYEALQDYIIQVARYGPGEQVTDWLVTPEMYGEVLKYLRSISRTNDELISNLATTTEIPVAGTMFDFHHYLAASTYWDVSTASASAEVTHPIIGLNMDSLRLNLVYGGDVEDSFLTPVSDFAPFPQKTNLFKRLHARHCFSIDNGRRSFVYSDKFKDA